MHSVFPCLKCICVCVSFVIFGSNEVNWRLVVHILVLKIHTFYRNFYNIAIQCLFWVLQFQLFGFPPEIIVETLTVVIKCTLFFIFSSKNSKLQKNLKLSQLTKKGRGRSFISHYTYELSHICNKRKSQ